MVRSIDEVMDLASAWADIDGVIVVAPVRRGEVDVIQVMASCPRESLVGKIPETFHGYAVEILGEEPPVQAGG